MFDVQKKILGSIKTGFHPMSQNSKWVNFSKQAGYEKPNTRPEFKLVNGWMDRISGPTFFFYKQNYQVQRTDSIGHVDHISKTQFLAAIL